MALPSLFVSHGAPTIVLDDTPAQRALANLAEGLQRPRAIVCATAHWETDIPVADAAARPGMIYDLRGFPAPPAPAHAAAASTPATTSAPSRWITTTSKPLSDSLQIGQTRLPRRWVSLVFSA